MGFTVIRGADMFDWFRTKDRFSSEYPKTGRVHSMLYGVFIGALLVTLGWLVMTTRSEGASGGSDGTTQGTLTGAHHTGHSGPAPATPTTTADAQPTPVVDQRLTRCREVYAAQRQPLQAAATSMAQWQVHIAAMNNLVLGVISLQQANQFWNQTRVGAHAKLQAFATADARLNRQTIRCPAPAADAGSTKVQRCERAVAANWKVLTVAQTALATWRTHVKHMEMLRSGMMSPAQATQMWLHSWHEGQGQVTRYQADLKQSHGLHC
jgi:hypothetical protein